MGKGGDKTVTFNLSHPCSTVLMPLCFGCSTILELDVNVHSSYLFLIGEIIIINCVCKMLEAMYVHRTEEMRSNG